MGFCGVFFFLPWQVLSFALADSLDVALASLCISSILKELRICFSSCFHSAYFIICFFVFKWEKSSFSRQHPDSLFRLILCLFVRKKLHSFFENKSNRLLKTILSCNLVFLHCGIVFKKVRRWQYNVSNERVSVSVRDSFSCENILFAYEEINMWVTSYIVHQNIFGGYPVTLSNLLHLLLW